MEIIMHCTLLTLVKTSEINFDENNTSLETLLEPTHLENMEKIFLFSSIYYIILLTGVEGHGALVNPVSRNAVDKYLPWSQRAPAQPCICANTTAGSATGPATSGAARVS